MMARRIRFLARRRVGKGVWVLPLTKASFELFEEKARCRPDRGHDSQLSHNEIMKAAGAEFYADWRDSDRARAAKTLESGPRESESV